MRAFFKDDTFDFLTRIALGCASSGCAEVGEVFAAIDGIRDGHADDWVTHWRAAAERLEAEAGRRRDAGHRASAAAASLRAAKYFETATYSAYGAKGDNPFVELWERYRSNWDAFLELTEVTNEALQIPYEGTTLPGHLLLAGDGARRTLVMNNGSDGSMVDMWAQGAKAALERGWNVVLFDGPGQGAALVRQQLWFRPDWEHVLGPVLDAVLPRPEVDADRVAVIGVSQGGYWVPRTLAFDHRFAAAVADPGVIDVSTTLLDQVPHSMVKLIEEGEKEKFDHQMATAERFSKKTAATIALRFHPYGLASPFDVYRRAMEFRLHDDDIARITTPLLLTDPDDEQFWPGQAAELHDKLPGRKALVRFTAEEGANFHCEPMGLSLRNERIFDWLDEVVPAG